MKILWLIPLTVDSAYQFTSRNELARALTEQGHEVNTVVSYRKEKVALTGFSEVEYIQTTPGSLLAKLRFHYRMLSAAWTSQADAVIFGLAAIHLLPIALLRGLVGRRPIFIMDIRSVPVDVRANWRGRRDILWYKMAILIANRFSDGVTVITPALAETVRPKLTRIRDRIGIWTSGVRLEDFEREGPSMRDALGLNSKKVLLHHGTLSPNRGLQDAIRAISLLRDEVPELVFLIVGDGEGRPELESLSRELGISERIIFTGKVPYIDIAKYIRSADVAILPFPNITWWAVSSPIKLMEYLAMGIPIIATDITAHSVVAKQTGGILLATNSEPKNLADTIREGLVNGCKPSNKDVLEDTITWRKQARNLIEYLEGLH